MICFSTASDTRYAERLDNIDNNRQPYGNHLLGYSSIEVMLCNPDMKPFRLMGREEWAINDG